MKMAFKKILSVLMALAITITCLPFTGTKVEAATNGVQEKINQLLNVYPNGSYFTVSGQSCVDCGYFNQHVYITGSWCPNCYLPNIPARGGLPAGSAVGWESDTCAGFAGYVYYNIFGHNHVTQTTVYSNASSASPGDLVNTGTHWFIYLWQDNSYYYGYDANSNSRGQTSDKVWICDQMVQYNRAFPKSSYPLKTVYHANNYDQVNGSSNNDYASITPGTYFLINKHDGKALHLAANQDYNTNNVVCWQAAFSEKSEQMVITTAPDGYKIRPIDSTRLVQPYGDHVFEGANVNIYDDVNDSSQWWKFEKTNGGYFIRNAQNTNLALTNSFSNDCNAVIWSYAGGNDQIWELVPAVAPGKPVISNVKSTYEAGQTVTVNWNSTSNTNQYNIALEKKTNGKYEGIFWKENVSSGYNLSTAVNLAAGDYRVRVASVNNKIMADYSSGSYYLSTIGDYVNFTVKEKAAQVQTYTITFNANGGTGTMSNMSMTVGTAKNLTANAFTRSGYTFLGWSTDKSETTAAYADKQSVKDLAASGTVTLYAVWKKNAAPANTSAIRIDNATAVIGQAVQVPVYIDKANLSGLTFTVKFDPKVLKYKSNSDNAFTLADVNAGDSANGSLTVACINNSGTVTGRVIILTFDVIADNPCTTKISVSASDAIDAQDNAVSLKASEATFTVAAKTKGDVNGDGKVTIADAKWVLQSSSGSRQLTDEQKSLADVNEDGKVTVADAKWLLQIASGSRKL